MAASRLSFAHGNGQLKTATTAAFNSSSGGPATMLIAAVALNANPDTIVFTDNQDNQWSTPTAYGGGFIQFSYAYAKNGGGALGTAASHTVTVTVTGTPANFYITIFGAAVIGTLTNAENPFHESNGAVGDSTGTITPNAIGDWMFAFQGIGATPLATSCATDFTIYDSEASGSYMDGTVADKQASATSAEQAVFSGGASTRWSLIASFKQSASTLTAFVVDSTVVTTVSG